MARISAAEQTPGVNQNPVVDESSRAHEQARLHGMPSDAEMAESIRYAVEGLVDQGLSIEAFTLQAVYDEGFTADAFCKLARSFTTITDDGILGQLLRAAIKESILYSIRRITVREFVNLCKWLKRGEGQQKLRAIYLQEKLKRKAGTGFSTDDVTLLQVFNLMLQDMSNAVKQEQMYYDNRIARYREKIRKTELAKEAAIQAVKLEFAPASDFAEPDTDVINRRAYEIYVERAQDKGEAIVLKTAMELYDQEVRDWMMLQRARLPKNRPLLHEYLNKKILGFTQTADSRQLATFRNYLVAIGGEEVAPASPTRETHPQPTGASEAAPPAGSPVICETTTEDSSPEGARAEGAAGDQTETTATEVVRTERTRGKRPTRQPQGTDRYPLRARKGKGVGRQ